MIITDIIATLLRIAQLAFAAIVAGVNGAYLRSLTNVSAWDQGRFIYVEVVAGLAMLLAILFLLPFSAKFVHWPADLLMSICWFIAFGLIVNMLKGGCGGAFSWTNLRFRGVNQCGNWKTIIAFSFLSAIAWLLTAIIGLLWVRDHERKARYGRRRAFGRTTAPAAV